LDEFELRLESAMRFRNRLQADAIDTLEWAIASSLDASKDSRGRKEVGKMKKLLRSWVSRAKR